ncbi:retropepsin-like aspartic protease [Tumidithrix elongata RA019]|uniref:Retropepsin-like aspartic protease n=1 Tax=Tumidithrix elongata BACA0141 TaxID=2716417 RepID=A0AAW9Q0T3_9CYAN|nr:retropepsin-like aspartic protease [Tumidithrix elongata RA019]
MKILARLGAIACLGISVLTASELFIHQTAMAQESDGCFMVDSKGRKINLGGLCNNGSQQRSQTQPSSTVTSGGVIQARIKRRDHGTPIIDVTFNNNQTYEMVLDTGASGTLITAQMAYSLQLQAVGAVNATIADGSKVRFPVGIVRSISIGTATVTDVPVAVSDHIEVGLLGHDFFENFDIKIKKDIVEFYPR